MIPEFVSSRSLMEPAACVGAVHTPSVDALQDQEEREESESTFNYLNHVLLTQRVTSRKETKIRNYFLTSHIQKSTNSHSLKWHWTRHSFVFFVVQ